MSGLTSLVAQLRILFDELRNYVRAKHRGQPVISFVEQRQIFIRRWKSLVAEVAAA